MSKSKGAFAPALRAALAGLRPSVAAGNGRPNWRETSASFRCPICAGNSWCQVARDGGTVLCKRVESDRTRVARDGSTFYVHHLGAVEPGAKYLRFVAPPRAVCAPVDVLDRAYRAVLKVLHLSYAHLHALHARGLSPQAIHDAGYRTLTIEGRAALARAVVAAVGEENARAVPGIVRKEGEHGPYLSFGGAAGLVIPVRDAQGRIVALCVRRDDASDGPKYCVISSTKYGGASPGAPLHWPVLGADRSTVVVTEGYLKADVAAHLCGRLVLGISGVAWRSALEPLVSLAPSRVVVAFDVDAATNPHVARAQAELVAALRAAGLCVQLARWDARDGKGLDDALLSRARRNDNSNDNSHRALGAAEVTKHG